MKVLLVADIHANWPALSAIQESFDACLFLGDLVDYGTDPAPCVDWVIRHATHAVRGNHDHAVAQRVAARGGAGLRELAAATRPIQAEQLSPAQLKFLARLPLVKHVVLGGARFTLLHATPRDPLDEYVTADAAGWQSRLDGVETDFLCVGHTHLPFQLSVNGRQVINPGSVGQPRDGDPRASYAVWEDGKVEFRRVEYDIDATLNHMRGRGLSSRILKITESILRTGGNLPGEIAVLPPDGL